MEKEVKKRKKKYGILKWIFDEIRDAIVFAVVWRTVFFVPRMIIRFFRNIY